MSHEDYEIPKERLPEGFRETVEREVVEPVPPRPAATVVLLREGAGSPEVLLLKRNRATGFVPGAYVFPGGRVDASDGGPDAEGAWVELAPAHAEARLGMSRHADPPAIAYYTAAAREAFEETGLLLANGPPPVAPVSDQATAVRDDLMEGRRSFLDLMEEWGLRLDGARIEYIAHWVTPRVEPRRYDTRFFAALVPSSSEARIDAREMTAAEWLTPVNALERHRQGGLPMIFPTIRTLEDLTSFSSARALMDHYRDAEIPKIMPEIVRTAEGVALRIHKP